MNDHVVYDGGKDERVSFLRSEIYRSAFHYVNENQGKTEACNYLALEETILCDIINHEGFAHFREAEQSMVLVSEARVDDFSKAIQTDKSKAAW